MWNSEDVATSASCAGSGAAFGAKRCSSISCINATNSTTTASNTIPFPFHVCSSTRRISILSATTLSTCAQSCPASNLSLVLIYSFTQFLVFSSNRVVLVREGIPPGTLCFRLIYSDVFLFAPIAVPFSSPDKLRLEEPRRSSRRRRGVHLTE